MDPLCHILTIPMVDIPKICCLVDKEKEGRPCDCVFCLPAVLTCGNTYVPDDLGSSSVEAQSSELNVMV